MDVLGLVPLTLEDMGIWEPREQYWGEENEPIEDWAQTIIDHGPRSMFRMEYVLPGASDQDPFDDPISRAVDLERRGQIAEARALLMELCQADLRCLDAHSHLGALSFDHFPKNAIRNYEAGFRIGELSLGKNFTDVLPWGIVDNRPFLRCMHGYGLCLWRLGRFDEAGQIFERMLWMNPLDNQGARFLIEEVKAGIDWEDSDIT